jgi:ABC-2 type transport system permease protein
MWWLFSMLMRYPREIFNGPWASPTGLFFTFVVPIILVTNVPANVMVKALDPWWLTWYALGSAIVVLYVSRRIFKASLQRYRSASS